MTISLATTRRSPQVNSGQGLRYHPPNQMKRLTTPRNSRMRTAGTIPPLAASQVNEQKEGVYQEKRKFKRKTQTLCVCVHPPPGDLCQTRRSALEPRVVISLSHFLSPSISSYHSFLTFPFLSPFLMTRESHIYILMYQ